MQQALFGASGILLRLEDQRTFLGIFQRLDR